MPRLWVVIPVYGREDIARVCLNQKALLVDDLEGRGVEMRVLVVGDDANLDTALGFGFDVLERPNVLGLKLNDGFEWACTEGGADFVSFVGSDDWLLASYLADLPAPDRVRTSAWAAFVAPTGDELIVSEMSGAWGNAPWIVPVGQLERCGFRPFLDHKMSGMDGQFARSLAPAPRERKRSTSADRRKAWQAFNAEKNYLYEHRPVDELRLVDFKGTREQITKWSLVRGRRSRVRYVEEDVWGLLATRYPSDLVEAMERVYEEGRA